MFKSLNYRWSRLSLVQQFLLAASVVLVLGMAAIGWWVSDRIKLAVIDNTANAAALYMAGSIAPLVQELTDSTSLSPGTHAKLDALMKQSFIKERVVSMKVWRTDGTIVYSTWKDMIGNWFEPSDSLRAALEGRVAASFESEPHDEDAHEQATGTPLLEIYAPVRASDSNRVIAVSEFYGNGEKLEQDITSAALLSWLAVGLVTATMIAALSGIVLKGSKTIDQQRGQLTNQITELQSLLSQNEDLRHRLQRSNENVADINERLLRRVGSDLHDGPVQLLTYAMLRLHKLAPLAESNGPQSREELQRMREAMGDALREVRHISSGLALPELTVATLDEALSLAIAAHEQRTDTSVSADIPRLPADVPHALKICAYRFVQEALTNAFRHGGGKDQRVTARATNILEISVSDSGPGFSAIDIKSDRLGLSGLRARIEAIGGTLEIQSTPHTVTILKARFDLNELRAKEAV